MIYRRFYIMIVAYVLAIVLCAAGIAFFLGRLNIYAGLSLILLVVTTLAFIRWLNQVNEKLAFFFSAVKNDDTSFRFPENTALRSEKILNKSLNDLNLKLRDARINAELQEKFYRSLMENVRMGIISFSGEGVVEYANPGVLRMFNIDHISHINRLNSLEPKLVELLKEIRPGEKRWINMKTGHNLLSLSVISQEIILQGRLLKIVSLHDIKGELDRQEMDSWQKLIRILNHEIMNSVTPITSLSATLQGFFKKGNREVSPASVTTRIVSDTVKGLDLIGQHGKGLINFVDSYRSLTRLPNPEFGEVRIGEFFERVTILAYSFINSEFPGIANKPSILSAVVPENLSVIADEKLLARVMINLIKNSIEAFDNKTSDNRIEIRAFKDTDDRIVLTVKDNGPGMDQEIMEKIFIPFFTTKESGSGIGLSLSRQIMRLHNGTITCDSSPGKGSVFSLAF